MINFKEKIAKKISEITKLDTNELIKYIENPPTPDLGDYAFPCFKLAKDLHKAPPLIANEIKANIKLEDNIIEKIEIVGGYLNIYINKQELAKQVLTEISKKKEKYGSSNVRTGKKCYN